jgi:hypothetical protein
MAVTSWLTIDNGTLGTSMSWSINSESSAYLHTITVATTDGKYSTTILNKGSAKSGSWTPPLTWANANTTGTSLVVEFVITTYTADGAKIGTNYKSKVLNIPDSVVPSLTVTVSDASGYASTYGAYIKGKSKVKVTITASGAYGSSIKSYRTTFNSKTYTASSFTTSIITTSGTPTVDVSVVDSRGRRSTKSVSVTVVKYENPAITALKVTRCADAEGSGTSGAFLKVTFSSTVFALDNKNTASYVLKYKKTTESEYISTTLTEFANQYSVSGGVFVFSAEEASSYNVTLTVTDGLGSGSKTSTGASATKFFSIFGKGLGFALGKIAELSGVFDIAFQTRHLGGLLHPVLENNTDLNDVKIPNTYVGRNAASSGYLNCPIASGTFTLKVEEAGADGQRRQVLTVCNKTASQTLERFYYETVWGDWLCTSGMGGKVLWSGAYFMHNSQTITLAEPISKQPSGAVFVWGWWDTNNNETVNAEFHHFFVHKYHVANFPGKSVTMADYYVGVKKQLYVHDEQINGHLNNDKEGTDTLTQLKYDNRRLVLRAVIGV